jgi:hypothetical protein
MKNIVLRPGERWIDAPRGTFVLSPAKDTRSEEK